MKPILIIKQPTQTSFRRLYNSTIEDEVADLVRIATEGEREMEIRYGMVPDHVADGLAPQSGVKAFDALIDRTQGTICDGNVWGAAQFSNYVRAETQTECNGATFAPGRLAASDIKTFGHNQYLVMGMVKRARESNPELRDSSLIVYLFRNTRVNYGYLITDAHKNLLMSHSMARNGRAILDEAARFVTKTAVTDAFDLVRSWKDDSGAWNIQVLAPELKAKIDEINSRFAAELRSQQSKGSPRQAAPRG